jgi:ankyrin repeat protein
MNSNFALTFALLLSLGITACGKKSIEDKNKIKTENTKSTEEISFELASSLKKALEKGDLELLKEVLRKSPSMDLNMVMSEGETMLTEVIKRDHRSMRDFLLEKGVSSERTNANKETPIIAAIISGQENSVRVLLDKDVDLNKKDAQGLTALHHAIMFLADSDATREQKTIRENLALLLIKSGAKVEITNPEDKNAYRLSIDVNSLPLQQLIRTIMEIEYGTPDLVTFRTVLQNGDVNSLNTMLTRYPNMPVLYDSINPLVIALGYSSEIITLRMLQLLINYKSPLNGPADAETTPLVKATTMLNLGFVRLLLDAGAQAQSTDREGKSALYYAITLKNPALVDLLILSGASSKYNYRKAPYSFSFDGCKILKKMEGDAKTEPEKNVVKEMRKSLRCKSFLWLSL